MAITVGERLPQATFKTCGPDGKIQEVTTEQLCKGKELVLLGMPGAFTPTCTTKHLPGFIEKRRMRGDASPVARTLGISAPSCGIEGTQRWLSLGAPSLG
jgi:peroxiredoxin